MSQSKRSTFVSPAASRNGVGTMAEAYERESHLSLAEDYWQDGMKIIAAARLIDEITSEARIRSVRGDLR